MSIFVPNGLFLTFFAVEGTKVRLSTVKEEKLSGIPSRNTGFTDKAAMVQESWVKTTKIFGLPRVFVSWWRLLALLFVC
jgi:hypothetical protein